MSQLPNYIEYIKNMRVFVGDKATRLVLSSRKWRMTKKKILAPTSLTSRAKRAGEKRGKSIETPLEKEIPIKNKIEIVSSAGADGGASLAEERNFVESFQREIIDENIERLLKHALSQSSEVTPDENSLHIRERVIAVEKASFLLHRYDPETFRGQFSQWIEERGRCDRLSRERQFLDESPLEIGKALRWMAERGGKSELVLLLQNKPDARYSSTTIQPLMEFAEDRLRRRVYGFGKHKQLEMFRCYRLFCPSSKVGLLPDGVYLIDVFPAFSFVSISNPDVMLPILRKDYAVELLEPLRPSKPPQESPAPATLPNQGPEGTMRDYILRLLPQTSGSWRERLEEAGAKLLQPLGGTDYFDYVVTIPTLEAMRRVKQLPEVAWIGVYQPQIRVNRQRFMEAAEAGPEAVKLPVLIANFFTAEDRELAEQQLQERGIKVLKRIGETDLALSLAQAVDPAQALDLIISQVGLRTLEEKARPVLWNNVACTILAGAEPMPSQSTESGQSGKQLYTGRGEIIAIADTGLDSGDKETLHPDLRGRIRDWQSYREDPLGMVEEAPAESAFLADEHGHGTHVAGSALGNGQAMPAGLPLPKGMASEAELVFQSLGKELATPDNLKEMFSWAYDRQARIHSNSWGLPKSDYPCGYYYQLYARQLDEFVWKHKDFLVVVAAGNAARQSGDHQPISQGNVSSPGIAKNCLTVGASENNRSNIKVTYGLYDQAFAHEPWRSRPMTDTASRVAVFSSRGPVAIPHPVSLSGKVAMRRKPDVVAPGTFVLSARSSRLQAPAHPHPDCWGVCLESPEYYLYMSGTSMATPLVAGAAAVVRQYLREERQIESPSAALLKAAIIHSAKYAGDQRQADDEQGWGIVRLSEIISPQASRTVVFIDESEGLEHGQGHGHEYRVEITDTEAPFRVTLVYTDESSSLSLVNNLNLQVCSPDNRTYLGNDFMGIGQSDSDNNVEGVLIRQPLAGEWTIRVIATKVATPEKQDYALVLSGAIKNKPAFKPSRIQRS